VGCGDCWYCTHGSHQLCEDSQQLGFVRPGVFAEYFIAPARYLYIIPDHVSFDEAVLTDIAANVLHAVQDAGVSFGDTVAVFGTGPAGFMAGQFARLCGASHVLLFGPIGNKVEMGRLMGIERMFDNTREEPDEFIKQQTDRETVDICIDCCGAELALTQMIRITRKQGHIELFGVFHQCPKVDLTEVVVKELSLSGSNAGPGCYDLALDFIAQGRLDVMPLITHRFSLHDAPQAFRLALADRTTYHKALLYPEGVPV